MPWKNLTSSNETMREIGTKFIIARNHFPKFSGIVMTSDWVKLDLIGGFLVKSYEVSRSR